MCVFYSGSERDTHEEIVSIISSTAVFWANWEAYELGIQSRMPSSPAEGSKFWLPSTLIVSFALIPKACIISVASYVMSGNTGLGYLGFYILIFWYICEQMNYIAHYTNYSEDQLSRQ